VTLDQLVLVRIQVRQLPKGPILRGLFYFLTIYLTSINPHQPSPRYGSGSAQPTFVRDFLIRSQPHPAPVGLR
jgi:hypothetical protein